MNLLEWLAGLLILIPFSVDQRLSIEVGQYTVRPQYLGAAIWILLWVRRSSFKSVLDSLKSRENAFFAVLGLSGLTAVLLNAPETQRSIFFLVWTIGTLIGVPAIARDISRRFGKKAVIALTTYYAVQALIIFVDAMICIPTEGRISLGRIMVYDWVEPFKLCRPSAFYQEPGYFAATAALVLAWIRARKLDLTASLGRYPTFLMALVIRLGLALSLSRLGWLLLLVILFFDARNLVSSHRTGVRFIYRKTLIVTLTLITLIAALFGKPIYLYLGRPNPQVDGSIESRTRSLTMALAVFKTHPIVGVGPGSASRAYFLRHESEILSSEKQYFRGTPLSQSLYGELLSEWGTAGTALFILGLLAIINQIPLSSRIEVAIILALIYTSTQTLPRFDLWFLVGLLTTSRALIKSDSDLAKL